MVQSDYCKKKSQNARLLVLLYCTYMWHQGLMLYMYIHRSSLPLLLKVYNNFSCSCQCDGPLTCPPMFTFDEQSCSCVCDSTFSCPTSRRLDTASCECVCSTICQPPQRLNDNTCSCECPPDRVIECPTNQVHLRGCICACL